MAFLTNFFRAGIVVFAFSLVGSWVSQLIGEPKGNNYQDKMHNVLTVVGSAVLVVSVLLLAEKVQNPLFVLVPALLLIAGASALRLTYEEGYTIDRFLKTLAIKLALVLLYGFANR